MPMWNIYHSEGTFETKEEKDTFVKDILGYYVGRGGFPEFYVVTNFVTLPKANIYRGSKSNAELDKPFIRLDIHHIHVHRDMLPDLFPPGTDFDKRIRDQIDRALKASIADKGYYFEYSVSEEPRELWKIDGLVPPPWRSEEEKLWVKEDRAVPWEEAEVTHVDGKL